MKAAMLKLSSGFFSALIFTFSCFAQENAEQTLDKQPLIENVRLKAPRQPRILAPTLAPEEIDQAVLNRLMQEIIRSPEVTKIRLGVDDDQLQDIFVAASNARGFINGSEMQNVRAMCDSWEQSSLIGDARIHAALDAYKAREQLTRNFIAKYYRVVLSDIETNLSEQAKASFQNYMNDRRRRMANAGVVSRGAIVQNLYNGAETINFYCHR